jgi:3-hydroxyisobutyrate dehydrogenase-like beta-hydroxyacid dehydrogenase
MTAKPTIGIIGLGKMGRPLGRHLLRCGYPVMGYDPVAQATEAAARESIQTLPSPAAVASSSDLVILLVGFESQLESALFGEDGVLAGARDGLAIAIGSTVSPRYVRSLADRLAGRNLTLLDVPSTRGEAAIEAGELLILAGAEEEAFKRWRPVFETFATDIFLLGPFGMGQVAKMVNNLILWSCMVANDEGLRLAEALGLDPDLLRSALIKSSAQNWSMSTRAEDRPVPWAEKDMMIVLQEADAARLSLPLSGLVKEAIKGYKIRRDLPTPREA